MSHWCRGSSRSVGTTLTWPSIRWSRICSAREVSRSMPRPCARRTSSTWTRSSIILSSRFPSIPGRHPLVLVTIHPPPAPAHYSPSGSRPDGRAPPRRTVLCSRGPVDVPAVAAGGDDLFGSVSRRVHCKCALRTLPLKKLPTPLTSPSHPNASIRCKSLPTCMAGIPLAVQATLSGMTKAWMDSAGPARR